MKTALVEALAVTFGQDYPEEDFRGVHVSMEYPVDVQDYPGIWVDYDDSDQLKIAGINHREYSSQTAPGQPTPNVPQRVFTRWRFSGVASFTCVALSSLECARLFDEVVRIMAFGRNTDAAPINEFRAYIEQNQFIAMNFDFDQIQPRGAAAAPGTPWGTDEIIYERTIDMEVVGEFISDGSSQSLVPLSSVDVQFYIQDVETPPLSSLPAPNEWQ